MLKSTLYLFTTFMLLMALSCVNTEDVNFELRQHLHKSNLEVYQVWHNLFKRHSKYALNSEEAKERFEYFSQGMDIIRQHNSDPIKTWTMVPDKWADRSEAEMSKIFPSFKDLEKKVAAPVMDYKKMRSRVLVPNVRVWSPKVKVDWTSVSGRVYDQGECGSCYSFAEVNSLEAHLAIKTGKFVEYSKQQLIDCNPMTQGCQGGGREQTSGYLYLTGLMTEADYPYTGVAAACKYDDSKALKNFYFGVEGTGKEHFIYWNQLIDWTDDHIYYLLTKGPVWIGMGIGIIRNYDKGIVTESPSWYCGCPSHAVILVGWGIDEATGVAYWKFKNSWGTQWGEDGYFRVKVERKKTFNVCIDYYLASIPILNE